MIRPQFSLRALLVISVTLGVAIGTHAWWLRTLRSVTTLLTPVEKRPIVWQSYSPKLLAEARKSGKPVLLFFDADWDLTTKTNLKVAIEQPEVRKLIANYEVIPIKADLTNNNKDVANEAINYRRYPTTPLIVIHDSRSWKPPVVLTGIQTSKNVASALRSASGGSSRQLANNTLLAPVIGTIGMVVGVALMHFLADAETRQAAEFSASSVASPGSSEMS